MRERLAATIAFALSFAMLTGCGSDGTSLGDIPRYPNATESESMEQSGFGGLVSASLVQFETTDTHDEVLDFYADALASYETKVLTHTLAQGHQTAISIPQTGGVITIAIQESVDAGKVHITFMRVGL